jgi:ribonucleoside-diphosphate reductase alpha chain
MNSKSKRPRSLSGATLTIETPIGKVFVTVNKDENGQPFEAFINASKGGSETTAISEAIGRLLSYILRLPSNISPIDRLYEASNQLSRIGGSRPLGMGENRVRSLPDGISQALRSYMQEYCADLLDPALVDFAEMDNSDFDDEREEV